jgi:FecR protein
MIKRLIYFAVSILFAAIYGSLAAAADKAVAGSEAVVTIVDGTAQVFTKDKASGRSLKKGDRLGKEHEVRVGERSRVEIRFPDGTVMRLSERSRLAMSELRYDNKTEGKNVKVNLGVGKLWANVRKLVTPDSSVEVKTSNAVAGVRGTVYRVNVEEDKSAMVKVYDGSVYVASPPKDETGKPPSQVSAPVPVPGPHEVPPPMHEVTMEEWQVIVKAMQQISISSQGVASQPENFDPKTDADDWVKWNQERDKKLRF